MPTYLIVSIVVVLMSAGGFVAARSTGADQLTTGAGDVEETPLPTPVPLETGTPLPTPAPMTQGAIVDTAVTFWGPWLSDEMTDALNEIIAAGRSGTAGSGSAAEAAEPPAEAPAPTPEPTAAPPALPVPVPVPAPTAVPLPPLPAPLPSAPLLVPLPTPPPLLP